MLRAGQRAQSHLDAAENEEWPARPAGQQQSLDPATGNRDRQRPGFVGHAGIVACYDRAMISRSDVEHVASLARLGLTDDEIDRLVPQLSRILEAVGKLADVDTSSVGPTAQVIALENVMRDDVARPSMERDAALAEAPLREGGLLRVPVVLEEGR